MAQRNNIPYAPNHVDIRTIHSAVDATVAVGSAIAHPCSGAKGILLAITGSAAVSDLTGLITFYASTNGVNFGAINLLISNTTNAIAEGIIRVANLSQASPSNTKFVWVDPKILGPITRFKVPIAVTDGGAGAGTFTVTASIQY